MRPYIVIRCVFSSLLVGCLSSSLWADAGQPTTAPADVHSLIRQLGSERFAVRSAAEDELRRLGRSAFEQLLDAQYDPNSEIQLTVRALLRQMPVRWPHDEMPQIVREITERYADLSPQEKTYYANWLVLLEDGMGCEAAVRIVRFEPIDVVSKQAALALIDKLDREEPSYVDAFLAAYRQLRGTSQRTAIRWLDRFAAELTETATKTRPTPTWRELAEQEKQLLETPRSDGEIVAMLFQKWAEFAFSQDDKAAAREAVVQLLALRKASDPQVVETATWLIEKEQPQLFRELVWEKFGELRESSPILAYCDCLAQRMAGQMDASLAAAEAAFALTENDEKFPDAFQRSYKRLQVAHWLEVLDEADLAIREYRRILAMETNWQVSGIQARSAEVLSELLHDRLREQEAADALQKILQADKGSLVDEFEMDTSNLSRMHYFLSEHHRQNGERQKQIEQLNLAIEANPLDADVLIAMHRLPRADQAWKSRTSKLIKDAVQVFEDRIKQLRLAGEFENREKLSSFLNQVAWLVGNTEGDYERAVQQSRRSLELGPASAGKLDTLGRAYFAAGNIHQALRYQRRAVRLQPSSYQIVRQLKEFEAAQP